MRIHRISLTDFRGVDSVEVKFKIDGVTIIEGRNEIGKTSIADAFLLLLDEKDSSRKQTVRRAQPVGRDVGPFVEADMTVGPYRLTYRKQWLKNAKTELEIFEPVSEQLTGAAAHARMEEILNEETDTALFKALRYQQGVAIEQADVGSSPTLALALDAAAGGSGSGGGPGGDALFEKVEAERQRYYTATGKLTADRNKKADELGLLKAHVAETEAALRELDEAVERYRQVENEVVELRTQSEGFVGRVADDQKALQAVEEVERRVETAQHENERAQTALRDAEIARTARGELIDSSASAAKTLESLTAEIAAAASDLEAAQLAVSDAKAARERVSEEIESAEKAAADSKAVVDLLELRLERDQLQERYERVTAAEETITEAERFLGSCSVDEGLFKEIGAAAEGLAVARARAEADKPRVTVEALDQQAVHVELDGESVDVVQGKPLEATVAADLAVVINDVVRVNVSRQRSDAEADQDHEKAAKKLADLLKAAGASSPEEAGELVRERARREADRDNAVKRRDDDLRDLDFPTLAAKAERAGERLTTLESEYNGEPLDKLKLDDERRKLEEAQEALRVARGQQAKLQTSVEAAESKLGVHHESDVRQQTRLKAASEEVERVTRELEAKREAASDDQLNQAASKAAEHATTLSEALVAVESDLVAGDPESVRARLENSLELQAGISEKIRGCEIEIARISARLDIAGRDGPADRHAEALAKLEDLERDVESEDRRAVAAERLHRVMSEQREKAQQAYVGPFRDKINSYSRILYGSDVDVTVDHKTLEITSRTLNGTTIEYQALSGGAREQLAVLARLACAALVSPSSEDGGSGGVPVVIDDALGYSDPGRLEALGAALSVAGRDCQVIVLTCEPGRYRGVGGASVVPLA